MKKVIAMNGRGEPMDDLISRQAAIDELWRISNERDSVYYTSAIHSAVDAVKALPSAEPERKKGRWIKNEGRSGWHCSSCKKDDLYAYPYAANNERVLQDFYCPNCGADMRGEEHETN